MYSKSDSNLQNNRTSSPNKAAYSATEAVHSDPNDNDREPIQVMVVGSSKGIENIIKGLHSLGFAEAGDWSKPQRYPNSNRSMSIVTKWRAL
ncbi:MAG: hypothetical protein AAFQ63_04440 [Cyanobacteria bacterium J06621_11]